MTKRVRKHWIGTPPEKCELCGRPIVDTFVDGKTVYGPWSNMCLPCHNQYGIGLGTGHGQKYQKQNDGTWLKVGG
jgi:hypothetical protein